MREDQLQENKQIPKVSIGMPVYNGETFIKKALDSLLSQTFNDFELIISDNASTDGTEEICRQYVAKNHRVQYIRQSRNMGAKWNFSFVLQKARGEYFMWASHDDIWGKNFIGECVGYLYNNDDIGLVFSMFWVTSRMYPFVKMKQFPHMSFLCDDDPFVRVVKFMEMEDSTYRANAIYGLWRRNIVKQIFTIFDGEDERFVDMVWEIAMMIYLLTMNKCFQIPRVLFYKTYKRFPPGHWLNTFVDKLLFLRKPYEHRRCCHLSKDDRIADLQGCFELLQIAIKRAGVWDDNYKNMLNANYERRKKRIRET